MSSFVEWCHTSPVAHPQDHDPPDPSVVAIRERMGFGEPSLPDARILTPEQLEAGWGRNEPDPPHFPPGPIAYKPSAKREKDDARAEAVAMRRDGLTNRAISEALGCSVRSVQRMVNGS